MSDRERLLKMGEVAEILGISKANAYHMAQVGELPSVRFGGGTVRVREVDLQAFILKHLFQEDKNVRESSVSELVAR